MKRAYSFKKKTSTDEIHIFEGEFNLDKTSCHTDNNSICNKMKKSDGEFILNGQCKDEQQAREKAANVGRSVCGDCVSHLYTTYK